MLLQLAFTAVLSCAQVAADAPVGSPPDTQGAPHFAFSEGPFERAWALVDPRPAPVPLEPDRLPPVDASQRQSSATWRRWAEALRSARASDQAAAGRLWLAAFAGTQGRHDDAWEHLAHGAGDAAGLCGVLPLLVPGVAPEALASWPRLPDGALLQPALPPPDRPASEILLGTGRLRRGSARVEGFHVGAARVNLSIRVEGDGVEVELEHVGGGHARVGVRLPEPPDFELRSEYLDWDRLEGVRRVREVELASGGEVRTLYGRYQPRRLEWPALAPPALAVALQRDGLRLLTAPDEPLDGLRAGLQDLLGLSVEVRRLSPGALPEPFSGVQVDLRDPATSDAKLASLVSIAERFALSAAR